MHTILASTPLFACLDPEGLQTVADELEPFDLPANGVLFRQGDPGDGLYLLLSGKLCILMRLPNGDETCMGELQPGEAVGEIALLTGQPRSATLLAVEDARLARLSKTAFDRLSERYPAIITTLTERLLPKYRRNQAAAALDRVFGPLDDTALNDLQERLAWVHLDSGEMLFRQGDPGDALYIVVQGRLRYAVEESAGARVLGEVGAGESIGEFALLTEAGSPESRRSATVYATRTTDLIAITRPVFEGLLCAHPQALLYLTRRFLQRQRPADRHAGRPADRRTGRSLHALTIAVVPLHPDLPVPAFLESLSDSLEPLGATLCLDAPRFEQLYGRPEAAATPLDHPLSLAINAWLDERERDHQHVLYAAAPALDPDGRLLPWAQRCVENADVVLLLAGSDRDPGPGAVEAALAGAHSRARRELALLHPPACELPTGTTAWLAPRKGGDFPLAAHHHLRLGCRPDFDRLARRLVGKPVGLALAGGGARGWAHIGAIQALEEAGIQIDWIAGASMGALLAGGYALGWSVERLTGLAAQFGDPKKLLDYTFPYTSMTATRRITALLLELTCGVDIEDTWRPFLCIAANLSRGEEQVRLSGPLWKAMRASMAFPGIFAPVLDDGCVLIDGGAANNLPIDRLREVCPHGVVIGVDLVYDSPLKKEYDFGPALSGWQALLGRLAPAARPVKAPTLFEIIDGLVYSTCRYRLNESEARGCADRLIRVPVNAFGLLEFDRYADIIAAGYRAAQEQLRAASISDAN